MHGSRDERMAINTTIRGDLASRLAPPGQESGMLDIESAWRFHEADSKEIGHLWPEGDAAVAAVSEQRREL